MAKAWLRRGRESVEGNLDRVAVASAIAVAGLLSLAVLARLAAPELAGAYLWTAFAGALCAGAAVAAVVFIFAEKS